MNKLALTTLSTRGCGARAAASRRSRLGSGVEVHMEGLVQRFHCAFVVVRGLWQRYRPTSVPSVVVVLSISAVLLR